MPDSAQQAHQNGDASRVQSVCSDMAEQAASGDQQVHTSDNTPGVDILPIPPALEFPYPMGREPSASPKSQSAGRLNTTKSPRPMSQPQKLASIPLEPAVKPSLTKPGPSATGKLQRIESAPIRPEGSREKNADRPRLLRQGSTVLQRISSRKNKIGNSFFDPSIYPDYQESSGEEDDSDAEPNERKNKNLRRVSTSPNQRSASNPYKRFAFGNEGYRTRGHVSKHDGRLNISLHETANKGYLAKALGASLEHHLTPPRHSPGQENRPAGQLHEKVGEYPGQYRLDSAAEVSDLSVADDLPPPKLNIVVMVIGSRGDIQPFLRLGKVLKEEHGHRVRIATHPTFKEFVEEDAKLEFFDVGGDPAELMAFMVKNPGLVPKSETLRSGEILRRRAQMFEMFQGFWLACISSSDRTPKSSNMDSSKSKEPFVADAIIANPPSFAHIHCAERLGIPLHLMFTFPNTPTQQFPHPLTNIRQTNVDANYTNFMSYPLVEMMQWQGLGDLINEFRVKTLGLDPLSMLWAPGQSYRMKVPYSYLWSPGLIPKPPDWGEEINITGFVFLDLASNFKPPDALSKFLDAGEPPVYIGFGSIVVDDPDKFTNLIFEAVKKAGVRALVSKGWGGIGGEEKNADNIFLLDNTPHDWLFPRVSAVVHHGGAGTTAIGLKCGKPTMVVPFFGDQPFWGAMVAKSNAGAEPVPYKQLSVDKLADGIKLLLTDEKQKGAKALSEKIAAEGDGAVNAVKSFHKHLPRQGTPNMRCSILRDRVAAWHLKNSELRLSNVAAQVLVRQGKLTWNDLRLSRVYDWNDFEGPGEPITGVGSSVLASLVGIGAGVGKTPFHWAKIVRGRRFRNKDIENKRGNSGSESKSSSDDDKNKAVSKRAENFRRMSSGLESNSDYDGKDVAKRLAIETGRGIRESSSALAKLPMELSLALAQGFHNAPRLYGDDTVRTTPRVTGFHSGCSAATSELLYGLFDGVTGLVRQPYIGAKYNGTTGFFKGVGKGAGGFVLKDLAALLGVPAYTLKGVHKELIKHRQPTAYLRRARIVESARQFAQLDEDEKGRISNQVSNSWDVVEDVHVEIRRTIKEKGFKGRVEVWRNRKWLKENGIIDNVRGMQRALEAHREGRDWEVEFREEKERHQREQAVALRARKEARKKRYEKDGKGKRIKGPDIHMKTRHGTYRALKKGARKSEKKAQNAVGTEASRASTQDNLKNQTFSSSPQKKDVSNTSGETAILDEGVVSPTSSDRRLDATGEHHSRGTAHSPSSIHGGSSSFEISAPLTGRSREDSGETLVQPIERPIEISNSTAKTQAFGSSTPSSIKTSHILANGDPSRSDRKILLRISTT